MRNEEGRLGSLFKRNGMKVWRKFSQHVPGTMKIAARTRGFKARGEDLEVNVKPRADFCPNSSEIWLGAVETEVIS